MRLTSGTWVEPISIMLRGGGEKGKGPGNAEKHAGDCCKSDSALRDALKGLGSAPGLGGGGKAPKGAFAQHNDTERSCSEVSCSRS